jgi:hypothetical protein
LNHYLGKCDFTFGWGYYPDPETAQRNQETVNFWMKHYIHAATDMQVNLVKQ